MIDDSHVPARWNVSTPLVGQSAHMVALREHVERVAASEATALIVGESGTGKEIVCRAIHELSRRANGPLVATNCAAIPRDLLEAILFGHERAAFTGAIEARKGLFEQADGGTILLDEISELPLGFQPALLRVLESRSVRRLAGEADRPIDVRVVAATNRCLRQHVTDGRFRADLFHRLNVIEIAVPALRERGASDVVALLRHFLGQFGAPDRWFTPEAIDRLVSYDWPGNVRELRNLVERVTVLTTSDVVGVDDLPEIVRARPRHPGSSIELARPSGGPHRPSPVLEAYARHRYNKSRAARELGLSRYQLIRRLRTLGEK